MISLIFAASVICWDYSNGPEGEEVPCPMVAPPPAFVMCESKSGKSRWGEPGMVCSTGRQVKDAGHNKIPLASPPLRIEE